MLALSSDRRRAGRVGVVGARGRAMRLQVMDQVLKQASGGAPEPRRRFSTITGESEEEAEMLLMNDVYGIDDDL